MQRVSNNADDKWLEKVEDIERYCLAGRPKRRTVREIADHFKVSIGWVSEELQLARFVRMYPECRELRSRQEVLDRLKEKKARKRW